MLSVASIRDWFPLCFRQWWKHEHALRTDKYTQTRPVCHRIVCERLDVLRLTERETLLDAGKSKTESDICQPLNVFAHNASDEVNSPYNTNRFIQVYVDVLYTREGLGEKSLGLSVGALTGRWSFTRQMGVNKSRNVEFFPLLLLKSICDLRQNNICVEMGSLL